MPATAADAVIPVGAEAKILAHIGQQDHRQNRDENEVMRHSKRLPSGVVLVEAGAEVECLDLAPAGGGGTGLPPSQEPGPVGRSSPVYIFKFIAISSGLGRTEECINNARCCFVNLPIVDSRADESRRDNLSDP